MQTLVDCMKTLGMEGIRRLHSASIENAGGTTRFVVRLQDSDDVCPLDLSAEQVTSLERLEFRDVSQDSVELERQVEELVKWWSLPWPVIARPRSGGVDVEVPKSLPAADRTPNPIAHWIVEDSELDRWVGRRAVIREGECERVAWLTRAYAFENGRVIAGFAPRCGADADASSDETETLHFDRAALSMHEWSALDRTVTVRFADAG